MDDHPQATLYLYRFNGEDGCDYCAAIAGLYHTTSAEGLRPHPNCDCEVLEVASWDTYQLIYRNVSIQVELDEQMVESYEFENNTSRPQTQTFQLAVEVESQTPTAGDEELLESQGISREDYDLFQALNLNIPTEVTLEPGEQKELQVFAVFGRVAVTAAVFAIIETDEGPDEVELGAAWAQLGGVKSLFFEWSGD